MFRWKYILISCLFLGVMNSLAGQNALEQGHLLFVKGKMEQAVLQYDQVLKNDSLNYDALYFKGIALYSLKKYNQCNQSLLKALNRNPKGDPALQFYLAESYFYQTEYAKALPHYRNFLKSSHANEHIVAEARKNERKATFAEKAILNPHHHTPQNIGATVNSTGQDFNPFFTHRDGKQLMYFCSHREGCTGGKQEQASFGYGADIYVAELTDSGWKAPQNIGAPVNTPDHERECSLTADGKTMVFARHPAISSGTPKAKLFITTWENDQWTVPVELSALNSGYCDSWGCISADGNMIYFASDRSGGFGGYDLYYSEKKDGKWSPPKNMGTNFNTPGDEYDPFITNGGGYFFFTSNGLDGFGGDDIFMCNKTETGWSRPENLGYPINSPADECDFYYDASNGLGYYNSKRFDSIGEEDIVRIVLKK